MLRRAYIRSAFGLVIGLSGSRALAADGAAPAPACGEVRFPLDVSIGGTPVASLAVGGRSGWFLIDSGASYSALDATRYNVARGDHVELESPLCGPASVVFSAEDMRSFAAPQGGQSGRIGTDILAQLAVAFSYDGASSTMTVRSARFDPATLTAAGFAEIDLPGFYGATTRRRPTDSNDVPVVGLAIGPVTFAAQLDTGFDDARDPWIVQGNEALLTLLRDRGVAMEPALEGDTRGCSGVRPYPRWRIESATVEVIAADGAPAGSYPPPLLEIKNDVACGGIAAFAEPFAQIGASWLGRWRTTILDGPGGAVWMLRPRTGSSPPLPPYN